MAKKNSASASFHPDPRKQRTREHIIEDLSINFVERIILETGCSVSRTQDDYGYDLLLTTYDPDGYADEGVVFLQLKATDKIEKYEKQRAGCLSFSLDMRDCRRWINESLPVFLILYDARKRKAWWVYVQAYFAENPIKKPQAKSVTIHIPKKNLFRRSTIKRMRIRKARLLKQMRGVIQHHD